VTGALTVLEPGLLTTIQDLGRTGLLRFGVTNGGALDQAALILGNRLVGNEPDAAGLELTLVGPRLRFEKPAVLALTGDDLGAMVNGAAAPRWQPFQVAAGDELAFAPGGVAAGQPGARAYLCLAGGVAVEPVMGARGTDLFAHFGGLDGRALRAGDRLALGDPGAGDDDLLRRRLALPSPAWNPDEPLRVVLGPQRDRFTGAAIDLFLREPYTVTPKADRMGLRLAGPALELSRGADMISEGIHQGSVQVPGDGQPIALTRARQTIGGYPKIATIIGADLDGLGQRRPGDRLRFTGVDVQAARDLTLAYRARLGPEAITTEPPVTTGWSGGAGARHAPTEERADMAGEWSPDAVARLVTDLQAAGVSYLKLEVEPVGLKLELRWGAAGAPPLPATDAAPAGDPGAKSPDPVDEDGVAVTAPMLGVFFRRPAPEQPPYADVGQTIEAGQPVGLIEVMKTFHEVPAPAAGTVTEFLVEDGQFVEYGQVIARLG
jgi:antagonist of KipI